MNTIEKMLVGCIEMSDFFEQLNKDVELQEELRNLLPTDAVNNPDHALWEKYSYSAAKKYDFDFLKQLRACCRFDLSISDNLNIFGSIRCIYCFVHPTLICTKKYEDSFDLYLDVVKDCYDGPEVRYLVEQIIQNALPLKTKKARITQARLELAHQFHLADKKRPRWIQGPEWPMGLHSPMNYVLQKRMGESMQYIFEDFDTKESRIIIQYY